MEIPILVRDKFEEVKINGNKLESTERFKTEEVRLESPSQGQKAKKKRKVRICGEGGTCSYKNVWTHPDRCFATFLTWHTCRHKGEERKI